MSEQGVIHVVDFLLTEYASQMAQQENKPVPEMLAQLKESASLMLFRQFAINYLDKNRPSAIQHAEWNFIIQLANGRKFAVAPVKQAIPGSMQESTSIPITGRETWLEMQRNATGMRGDMTQIGGQQNLMANQPAFSFDQPGQFNRADGR